MNSIDNINKLIEGVESALSLKQSDFGVLATHYFEALENGDREPIDLFIAFKKVEKFVETILPMIKSELDEHTFTDAYKKYNVSLQAQNGRAVYDFSNCNDNYYNELKEAIKQRETFLKSITKPTEIIDEETGDVNNYLPPIKKQGINLVLRYDKA